MIIRIEALQSHVLELQLLAKEAQHSQENPEHLKYELIHSSAPSTASLRPGQRPIPTFQEPERLIDKRVGKFYRALPWERQGPDHAPGERQRLEFLPYEWL
jgi:hypothetical protein